MFAFVFLWELCWDWGSDMLMFLTVVGLGWVGNRCFGVLVLLGWICAVAFSSSSSSSAPDSFRPAMC